MGKRVACAIVGALATAGFLLPGAASASTVSVSAGKLNVVAGSGEENFVTVETVGATFRVADTGASLTTGAGCAASPAPGSANEAICPTAGITRIMLGLGNGDDDAGVVNGTIPATISGGSGIDRLVGGGGPDMISAGPGAATVGASELLIGGGGGDTMNGSTGSTVTTSFSGGEGDDVQNGGRGGNFFNSDLGADSIRAGDGSFDQVSYSTSPTGVTVTVGAAPAATGNDGTAGEGDDVSGEIDVLVGSNLGDTLVAAASGAFSQNINGGGGADILRGSVGSQVFDGGTGDDTIKGSAGNDQLGGGPDNDTLEGETGNDSMNGGPGGDTFIGSSGFDSANYFDKAAPLDIRLDDQPNDGSVGEGDNVRTDVESVVGGSAADLIIGSVADDELTGGGGGDDLRGGPGDDRLTGDAVGLFGPPGFNGADTLNGGGGGDVLDGGGLGDTFIGGTGDDTATYVGYATAVTVTIGAGAPNDGTLGEGDDVRGDVEDVIGGSGGDSLTGNSLNNSLLGGVGSDQLNGAAGNDYLEGDGGTPGPPPPGSPVNSDIFIGGPDTDTVSYSYLRTGPTGVTADIGGGSDGITGSGEGDDVQSTVENLIGSQLGDTLTGSATANLLLGKDGPDTLNGGLGNDTLDGGNDQDTNNGGGNADFLRSRNDLATFGGSSTVDTNNCGGASDRVVSDAFDTNNADCEST